LIGILFLEAEIFGVGDGFKGAEGEDWDDGSGYAR
jgi:hypothetical protein